MFLGTHPLKIDDKGRLIVPARFRDELAEGVVVTKGQERCLFVFRALDFADLAAKLNDAPITGKSVRDHSRVFFASAFDQVPDKQGRITVPVPLRAYADLSRDAVVIGANSRLEIWDAAAWSRYESEQEPAFAQQSQEVLPGVF